MVFAWDLDRFLPTHALQPDLRHSITYTGAPSRQQLCVSDWPSLFRESRRTYTQRSSCNLEFCSMVSSFSSKSAYTLKRHSGYRWGYSQSFFLPSQCNPHWCPSYCGSAIWSVWRYRCDVSEHVGVCVCDESRYHYVTQLRPFPLHFSPLHPHTSQLLPVSHTQSLTQFFLCLALYHSLSWMHIHCYRLICPLQVLYLYTAGKRYRHSTPLGD